MNNAIGYPHEERLGGRPTYRTSGIHDELLKAGAFMGFHAGWEQPDWYATPGRTPEYKPSFYRLDPNFTISFVVIKLYLTLYYYCVKYVYLNTLSGQTTMRP